MTERLVVIDTNCLVQMISKRSPYRPIWDAFLGKRFVLCVSNDILDEYQEILERLTTPHIAENVVLLLMNSWNVRYVNPQFRLQLIVNDKDDNKFVDCAFACGADYIVSEDSHFDVVKDSPFPMFNVVTMDEFMETLK
ncbi:MAG: putative toxin-antitoxin system toxin component, PIN family [Prevotellaceae bacterium]|nr:putative toxin-antitoxin system toxin component, PIN family [Candidatus Minthosoma caballi]